MNTKQKGLVAEHQLKTYFLQEGYDILNPEGDYSPYDFVVYKNNEFMKIQSKYVSLSDNGTITVDFSEIRINDRVVHKGVQLSEIDIIGVYCPDTNKCYFIRIKYLEKDKGSITLRISDQKITKLKTCIGQ